jgi:hypothetical protein
MTKRARCAQIFFFQDVIELEFNHQNHKTEHHLADNLDSDKMQYSELKTESKIEPERGFKHNRSPHGYPP